MGLKIVPAYKRFRPKHVRHEASSAFIPKLWSEHFAKQFYGASVLGAIGVKTSKKGGARSWESGFLPETGSVVIWREALESMAEWLSQMDTTPPEPRYLVLPPWFSRLLAPTKGKRSKRPFKGRLRAKKYKQWEEKLDGTASGTAIRIQGRL